jgi:hypothetical protein
MEPQSVNPLDQITKGITDYLPTLGAGLLVLVIGLALGWVAKRAVVRTLVWFRLDRLARRAGWRAAFGKGDVRAALYNLIGNLAFIAVVLIFFDNALQIWGLGVLSVTIDGILSYLPNLLLVGLIIVGGVMLSNFVSERAEDAFEEEDLARARLLAKLLKGILLSVVGALALWQLNFARQIVLAAFLIAFGALGVAFALAVGLGSMDAIRSGLKSLFKRDGEE